MSRRSGVYYSQKRNKIKSVSIGKETFEDLNTAAHRERVALVALHTPYPHLRLHQFLAYVLENDRFETVVELVVSKVAVAPEHLCLPVLVRYFST